jgi:hypothetical protein
MTHVMENGGEVYSERHNDCRVYDRIILTDGFAVCINKQAYQQDVYAQDSIKVIHSHTKEHEGKEWW